jgi:DNA-binding NarL/FixJ family response regulator
MVDLSAKDCRPIDRLGYRYEAALALMATKDETLFRESLTRLTDLGPIAAARLVRRPMRELDIGEFPPAYAARARTHLRGLTNCEQEILDLVSDGQSNEVIAATLFISVKIVEHHGVRFLATAAPQRVSGLLGRRSSWA